MKAYKKWLAAGITMVSALTLAACSNNGGNNEAKSGLKPSVKMSDYYDNKAKSTSTYNNGTLKVAEYNSSPFVGMTSPSLQTNGEDGDVYAPGSVSLFKTDADNKVVDGGLANLKLDKKSKTATITLRDNAKWSNGSKITAKDVEYPYEIISAKDTTSQQYSEDWQAIDGMAAYHTGKAKTISGIKMPDGPKGNKVVIHYNRFAPSLQYGGNSYMWSSIEPYEYIKNVPISKLGSSSQIRKNPIWAGPYKMSKQVVGESTSWVPNKYYYGKQAQIKHVDIQVVNTSNFVSSLKSKQFDFSANVGISSEYPQIAKMSNYTTVGSMGNTPEGPQSQYSYLAFNLGHMDTKTQQNVMDKNTKMANLKLRQAMLYALDIGALRKKFNNGLAWYPNSLISPYYKKYYNSKSPRYMLNMKKANQLLDQAGYKKKGKWRVQPNGKPLTINYGAMTSTPVGEAQYNYYLQQWRKLGLNAQFAGGRPMDMNKFYAILEKPKQDQFDVFSGAFGTASEPTPTGFYGSGASFNMAHFATKKNTQLLNDMNNDKAWNDSYRAKQFKDWQTYMQEQAAYIPTSMGLNWYPVNKRVKGYDIRPGNNEFWSNLSLTSSKPE
ncbi:ABC transporter substrate-binding protein [Apilactobacillus ozensis]|uniref:ABC transporter substrate-binding protein n=1 Tax=Apilactobacillus ozensis TaxID=866801 RepID=UPI00200A7332|nr:ABC transporter substrate-binding protein [Apilactobacillus ozensis]MCK8606779.1 ABC transporter substrate-binding protein [Apilactobacillus ozensis]